MEQRLQSGSDRLENQRSLTDKLGHRLDSQRSLIHKQRDRLDRQGDLIREQGSVLKEMQEQLARLTATHAVLAHQMASIETRMQRVSSRSEPSSLESTPPERVEARKLLEEMRDEHARIRTRFGVVTRYEERVRRLEVALEAKPGW